MKKNIWDIEKCIQNHKAGSIESLFKRKLYRFKESKSNYTQKRCQKVHKEIRVHKVLIKRKSIYNQFMDLYNFLIYNFIMKKYSRLPIDFLKKELKSLEKCYEQFKEIYDYFHSEAM